jgi:hypothetical protein
MGVMMPVYQCLMRGVGEKGWVSVRIVCVFEHVIGCKFRCDSSG